MFFSIALFNAAYYRNQRFDKLAEQRFNGRLVNLELNNISASFNADALHGFFKCRGFECYVDATFGDVVNDCTNNALLQRYLCHAADALQNKSFYARPVFELLVLDDCIVQKRCDRLVLRF